MTWFAIHDQNGKLVSITEIVTDSLPANLAVKQLAAMPDLKISMWDEVTRSFVSRPAPVLIDRLDDLRAMTGVTALWNSLSAAQKTVLANALIKLLGGARYRKSGHPVEVQQVEP